jgi:RNA polymerase sigma factor (sigma-70 family)
VKLTEEQVIEYAKQCAKAYVAQYGRSPLIDVGDAYSIAWLALSKNDEYDETRSPLEIKSLIKTRGVNAIVREYQKLYGLRRKNPIKFVPLVEGAVDVQKTTDRQNDEYDERVKQALSQAFDSRSIEIVAAILEGGKQVDVARRFHISEGRVSQIFTEFRRRVRCYQTQGENVCIIETTNEPTLEERRLYPLLYWRENETN